MKPNCRYVLLRKTLYAIEGKDKRRSLSDGTSRPIKPAVKTGRSEGKLKISPSGELVVSSESEKEEGWRKGKEDEADAECLHSTDLFSKDHDVEEWVRC
jgi:hypothetical protein